MARKSKKLTRKVYLLAAAGIIVVGTGLFMLYQDGDPYSATPSQKVGSQPESYVNLNPPTDQEKQATDEHKQSLSENQSTPPPTPSGTKKQVTPIITSVTQNEVKAYVQGVFEEGGKCTLIATKGSQTVSGSSSGLENVSYTSCIPISVSLPPGSWSITVSYSSATADGKTTQPFNVQ